MNQDSLLSFYTPLNNNININVNNEDNTNENTLTIVGSSACCIILPQFICLSVLISGFVALIVFKPKIHPVLIVIYGFVILFYSILHISFIGGIVTKI